MRHKNRRRRCQRCQCLAGALREDWTGRARRRVCGPCYAVAQTIYRRALRSASEGSR